MAIRNPFVKSHLNDDFTAADVTISADLRNDSGAAVKGVSASRMLTENPSSIRCDCARETKTVRFEPAQFAELKILESKTLGGRHHRKRHTL